MTPQTESEPPQPVAEAESLVGVATHDLLACPFCGGQASASGVVRYQPKHEAWWADKTRITKAFFCNCLTCGTTNKGLVGHQTPEAAVKHWNTRCLANTEAMASAGLPSAICSLPNNPITPDTEPS